MGNSLAIFSVSKKSKDLPIQTIFKFPSPIPNWPPGGGFASGIIDLGGLQVCQVTTFTKVWAINEGGQDNLGATFFEPSPLPDGFSMLGCYSQPNNQPLFGWVLAGKDASGGTLAKPVDYTLAWSSVSMKTKQDGPGYIWIPIPPDGYKAVGSVVTTTPNKPSLDKIHCVRSDLTDTCEINKWIWGPESEINPNGFNVYSLQPSKRGRTENGVSVGTFMPQDGTNSLSLSCLKNSISNLSSMPNLNQIKALLQAYSPWIYFHPKEIYLPSSVNWYFENGALLYSKGNEANPNPKPIPIEPNGSNLPQGGPNDGTFWLDLPVDKKDRERVMKGDLGSAEAYAHVKPMLGGTFTDIAMWVFYPFNGPATAKLGAIDIPLGKIGQHVGDWEHVTLRISNFDGVLCGAYFSEHSSGAWIESSSLEFQGGNKPMAYASLNGHAFYPKAGLVLQGGGKVGIRNDTARSEKFLDCGEKNVVVSAEHLGGEIIEPMWLNYTRKWGPKIDYDAGVEAKKVEGMMDGRRKSALESLIKVLPNEVRGEEGPTGPKLKKAWNGDEV